MSAIPRVAAGAMAIALACPGALSAAERYDPRLAFQQLRTAHFTIYFHQGEEALARRLAVVAEDVRRDLAERFDAAGALRHAHVILVDQDDDANGWATPLPYNTIEITAAAPSPSSLLGYTDDWLRLVFTHEYAHVLHLDRSRGLFRAVRAVFGRAPLAFPNLFLPVWNTEGLATAVETAMTGLGRLEAGDFRAIVDAAAAARRFETIDRASGGLVDWPGGHAPYAFGARFHEFLARRYGAGTLGELADVTAGRVPYFSSGAYRSVFGKGLGDLWREFEADAAASARAIPETIAAGILRLTAQGFVIAGPRWTPDGRALVYSSRTPHGFPSLMEVPATGGSPHRLADRYLGERAAVTDRYVLFDQYEYVRSVGLQADLYAWMRQSDEVIRVTRGTRISDPDISKEDALIAVVRRAGRADLVQYDFIANGSVPRGDQFTVVASEPDTQHAAPRWSPDGTRIAAERRRLGQTPEVVVIDARTHATIARIAADEGRVGEPEWMPDGRSLIVSWERPREPFNLYHVDLESGTARTAVRLPGGARAAAVSPDGRRVAFIGYTPEGYDLFTAALKPDEAVVNGLSVARLEGPALEPAASDEDAAPYNPLPTLLPRFWMPIVDLDVERIEVGAATIGTDALGRHVYTAAATWSDGAAPDWAAVYAYDRWRPTMFLAASDDSSEWQGEQYRERVFEAGAALRFRTVRRTQSVFGSARLTREEDPRRIFDRRSLRLAYQVSTARRYGYSISRQDGVTGAAAFDITRRAFGADANGGTLTADLRAYPRLGGRHRVLALRAAAGASWGEEEARRLLGAGGVAAPASSGVSFGRDAIGLARGFATDDISGYRALVLNADYRVPLAVIERGYRTWPVFVRQLHAAAFLDAAHAWSSNFRARDLRLSAGAELSLDVVLGHYLPLTLTTGVAARRDPSGLARGAAVFARVGSAF